MAAAPVYPRKEDNPSTLIDEVPFDHAHKPRHSIASLLSVPDQRSFFVKLFLLINIEPTMLFFCMYAGMSGAIQTAFFYYKSCVNRFGAREGDNTDFFCGVVIKSNDSLPAERKLVEADTAQLEAAIKICTTLPAVVTSFVFGTWSDRYGRKLPLIICLAGNMLATTAYTYLAWRIESTALWLIGAALITGISGQHMAVYMVAYSCVRDIAPIEELTLRIAILQALTSFGSVVGNLISAYGVDRYGYITIYLMCEVCIAVSFFYSVFVLKETKNWLHDHQALMEEIIVKTSAARKSFDWSYGTCLLEPADERERRAKLARLSRWGRLKSWLNELAITETMRTMVKSRPDKKRLYLILGLVTLLFTYGADSGAGSILLLFFKLPPLSWTDSKYAYYTAFGTTLSTVGTPICTAILKNFFHLHETVILIFACIMNAAKYAFTAFCVKSWQVFAAALFNFASHTFFPSYRSFLASLVPSAETGRVFSLISAFENLAPMWAALAYSSLYPLTIDVFPGFMLLFSSGVILIGACFILYILVSMRLQKHHKSVLDENDDEEYLLRSSAGHVEDASLNEAETHS